MEMVAVTVATEGRDDSAVALAAAEAALLASDEMTEDESDAILDKFPDILDAVADPNFGSPDITASSADIAAALLPDSAPLSAIPPAPGHESSPFRRCSCIGSLPGRTCLNCNGARWTKICEHCAGRGLIETNLRGQYQSSRKDRCGFCMGRGATPAQRPAVEEAQRLHDEAVRAGVSYISPERDPSEPAYRRPPKLPMGKMIPEAVKQAAKKSVGRPARGSR